MASKLSFTIRRPTPVSRATSSGPDSDAGSSFKVPQLPSHLSTGRHDSPLARSGTSSPHSLTPAPAYHDNDSSDAESAIEDELVTGFDSFGVQRCVQFSSQRMQLFELTQVPLEYSLKGQKKADLTLVIPALKNKDWRELARKRRSAAQFVPPSSAAQTGQDGSVGGLGTRDIINSGPVLSGLQVKQKKAIVENDVVIEGTEDTRMEVAETDDQVALRAILAEINGSQQQEGPTIDTIPTPMSEADALKQDVAELPDAATLEDYNRVPVSQFGAAMLRGMGWKEGTAATRKSGRGMVEPYIPVARPALLGIGAKEQEVFDDGSKKTKKMNRPERRYVPIIKQERSNSASANDSGSGRRQRSRSPRRSATSSGRSSPDRYNSRQDGDRDAGRLRYDDERYKNSDKRYLEEKTRSRNDERDNRYTRYDQDRETGWKEDRRRDGERSPDRKRDRYYDSARRRKDH